MSGAAESILDPGLAGNQGLDRIVPHAGKLLASQVIRRVFRMAVLFLAARMLGVESFGVYALLLTVVEMTALVSGAGYVDFLAREVAERPDSAWRLGKRVTALRLTYILPALGLALLILAILRFPSSVIANVALFALTLVPRSIGESAQGILKGLRQFSPLPWVELAQGLTVLVCAPVLILKGMGVGGLIAAEVFGAVTGAVLAVRSLAGQMRFSGSDGRTLRDLARCTLTFNVYPLISNIYDRADVVLLSKLAGNFAVGIYSLPYRVFSMLLIVPYGLMGALLPVFSSDSGKHDAQEICAGVMKFLFVTALLVVLLTLAFSGPAVLLLLGQGYWESIITVKILVWAAVPAFLSFALNVLLLSAHKERAFLWTATICTIFNITANLLLIRRFSYIAAAAVTVATECLLLGQNLYLTKRFIGRMVLPKDGLKIAVVFALVLAGFWLMRRAVPQLWAGSVACAAFAVFAAGTMPGLRHFAISAARKGVE